MITGKKRKFIPQGETERKEQEEKEEEKVDSSFSLYPLFVPPMRKAFNNQVLFDYLRNPSKHSDSIVYNDDKCIIIKDAYPKAAIHLLLLAKESFLVKNSIKEILIDDLAKLKSLHDCAKSFVTQITYALAADAVEEEILGLHLPERFLSEIRLKHARQNIGEFYFGYHIIPSLFPLHLHIISSDFISSYLKNKKHWNSFTTEYFVHTDRVEEILEGGQEIREVYKEEECEKLLNNRLKCPHCNSFLPNIPELKRHLTFHYPSKLPT